MSASDEDWPEPGGHGSPAGTMLGLLGTVLTALGVTYVVYGRPLWAVAFMALATALAVTVVAASARVQGGAP